MTARDRLILIILGVVGALAAAWFLLIQPERKQASQLASQISSVQSQLSTAQSTVAAGEQARGAFTSSYTTLARLGEAVPSDDDVPSLIVQVQSAASGARVDFGGLTLSSSSGTTTSSTPSSASSSSSTSQASTATLPPGASVGSAGFPLEPFTFTFTGSFFNLSDFFGRLERFVVSTNRQIEVSGRLLALNGISLAAGPKGFPQITATVAANSYILPATQGLQLGASPSGPSSSSTTQASSSGSSSPSVTPAVVAGGAR